MTTRITPPQKRARVAAIAASIVIALMPLALHLACSNDPADQTSRRRTFRRQHQTRPGHLPLRHVRRLAGYGPISSACTRSCRTCRRPPRSASDSRSTPPRCRPEVLANADLDDPATTVALLKLDAVVGIRAYGRTSDDRITRLGITCALCHSTVDDSVTPGIGQRLDGWPNPDLDVGRDHRALARRYRASRRPSTTSWGAGKYDPRFNIDGKSTPLVLPPAYGLARRRERNLHGRRAHLVLERVRRGHADGRPGQVRRPAPGHRHPAARPIA